MRAAGGSGAAAAVLLPAPAAAAHAPPPPRLLAAPLQVDVWTVEQRHNASSPYRFHELTNNGLGPSVAWTGMTWSGFRPSDDASQHGFPIPANM